MDGKQRLDDETVLIFQFARYDDDDTHRYLPAPSSVREWAGNPFATLLPAGRPILV